MKKLVCLIAVLVIVGGAFAGIREDLLGDAVMYMRYEETSGVSTADSSGNGYDGEIYVMNGAQGQNPTTDDHWGAGKFGGGLHPYVETGGGKLIDAHIAGQDAYSSSNWGLSFWVMRPTSRHIGWGSNWGNIWSCAENELNPINLAKYQAGDEDGVNWTGWDPGLEYDHMHVRYDEWASDPYSGRNVNTYLNAGGASQKHNVGYALGDEWGNGIWQHVVMNYIGTTSPQTSKIEMFINNTLVAELNGIGGGWGSIPLEAFSINSGGFKGIDVNDAFDDYYITDRNLTGDEIAWIYADGVGNEILPEPASLALLGLGGLVLRRRK